MAIEETTSNLFVDSICELMILGFERIEVSSGWIKDNETDVMIKRAGSDWLMYIPMMNGSTKGVYITETQLRKVKKAISKRENNELIIVHEQLYNNDSVSAIRAFSGIQKLRKSSPMVEEAWQQLMTIYALNLDSEQK